MPNPQTQWPDIERLAVDLLTERLQAHEPAVTVSVGVPKDWDPASSPPHISVAWDGTPWTRRHTFARGSVRFTARAASTTEAKRLALLAEGLLVGQPGGGVTAIRSHLSIQPTRDPETDVELAWFACGFTVRSQPVPTV